MQLSLRIFHYATCVAIEFLQFALRCLDGKTALFRSVLRILFCILLVKFLAFVFKKIDNLVGAIKSHVVDHDKIVERNGFALKLYLVKTFFRLSAVSLPLPTRRFFSSSRDGGLMNIVTASG